MDVLEELTEFEDRIDRAHVERRIDDWRERIASLFSGVESWLPLGWSAREGAEVWMHEDVMRNLGIAERQLPSLDLNKGDLWARLEPRALWIIGANGRLDLVSSQGHYVIIDRADLFTAPLWTISKLRDQLNGHLFTRESLAASFP